MLATMLFIDPGSYLWGSARLTEAVAAAAHPVVPTVGPVWPETGPRLALPYCPSVGPLPPHSAFTVL